MPNARNMLNMATKEVKCVKEKQAEAEQALEVVLKNAAEAQQETARAEHYLKKAVELTNRIE